jgi:hypothetical protein
MLFITTAKAKNAQEFIQLTTDGVVESGLSNYRKAG